MKQREMTVYRARGTSIGTNNPRIMLQGKWLRDVVEKDGIRCMMTRRAEPERHDAACRYVVEKFLPGSG